MNETVRLATAPATPGAAPLLAGPWDHHRVTAVTISALLPALGVSLAERAADLVPVLGLALLVTLAWTLLFARIRRRPAGWDWIVTAATFAILIPATVPFWQQGLALSFGVVMGDLIFGGRGRNFLHPTVVAIAFLLFSFPDVLHGPAGLALPVAAALGGLLLVVARLVSWRTVGGIAIGAAASLAVAGESAHWGDLLTGAFVFGSVFLIGDLVCAAATPAGRWAYGLLAGMLIVVFGQTTGAPGSLHAVTFAALLASLFAPLIDYAVVGLNVRRRRRRG